VENHPDPEPENQTIQTRCLSCFSVCLAASISCFVVFWVFFGKASWQTEARLSGTEINALHRIEIHGLTRLPEIMAILHGQPTFR